MSEVEYDSSEDKRRARIDAANAVYVAGAAWLRRLAKLREERRRRGIDEPRPRKNGPA